MDYSIKREKEGKTISVSIKNVDAVKNVIEERKKFKIMLVSFDKELVRTPTNQKAFLPRYNRLLIEVSKTEPSNLKELTLSFRRIGSKVGDDNIEYITIDVSGLKEGEKQNAQAYLFDAFNVPFEDIVSLYQPEIDLLSPMRAKFREIMNFLDSEEQWGENYKLNMGM